MAVIVPFREEMNERYERAAAIAVFQGDIKLAISSLKEGAQAKQHGTGECGNHDDQTTPTINHIPFPYR